MDTPAQRLELWRQYKHGDMKWTDVSDLINIPYTTLKSALGKGRLSSDIIRKLRAAYADLNIEWLQYGEGEMVKSGNKPFFPAGKMNKSGATQMPAGSMPDLDMSDADPEQPTIKGSGPAAQTDREFIETLLAKIKRESVRADQAEARETKLYAVVHEQAGTIRFLQEQVNDLQLELRGKELGNQAFAPGAPTETPRAIIKGLRSYDQPDEGQTQCVVRPIRTASASQEFCFGESEEMAA